MRVLLPILALLAACSGGGGEGNKAAPAPVPKPTGPAPRTPVTGITPAPGKTPAWLGARPDPHAPKTAPYGNLLDQPVVKGNGR